MLAALRQKMGLWFLRSMDRPQPGNRKAVNLGEAQSVRVLYHAPGQEMPVEVKAFTQHLREEVGTFDIRTIGYYPNLKEVEAKSESDVRLGKKEVNFLLRPRDLATWKLKPVDLLIDLSLGDHLPLLYVAAATQARMKVGESTSLKDQYYELLIRLPEKRSLDQLIEQTLRYLQMLNRKTHVHG